MAMSASIVVVTGIPQISNRIPTLCTTLDGDRCIFPFVYKNVTHLRCTYADSPTPWCATRVDQQSNEVITNRWGDCLLSSQRSSCPAETLNLPSCTTVSGPDTGKSCIFPFRHNGVTYKKCTSAGLDQAWCSTKVNSNGEHIGGQGFYGICPTSCPGGENNANQLCKNRDRWTEGCSTCECITGKAVCTYRDCSSTSCTPGDVWQVDCNTCICTPSGTTSCTEKACTASSCTTNSGPGAGLACAFPFTWAGQTYSSCTQWIWSGPNQGSLWCSTKTDSSGNHINGQGNYGFCPSSCADDQASVPGIGARIGQKKKKKGDVISFGNQEKNPANDDDVVVFVEDKGAGNAPM